MEEQKVLNVQTSQKIEALESSVNRKLDNMHSEISKLSNQQLQSSEKEKAPFKGQQYQNMVNEIGLTEDINTRTDEVKSVVTLRSGRELQTAVPELVKSAPVVAEPLQKAPVNFWPWTKEEEITALLTEKSSGHETVEGTQETIIQPNPIDLDPNATAQPKNNPLLVPPSADLVYIQPQPATNLKPAAPKAKSNPLPAAPPDSVFILPMPTAQPKPQASTTKATPSLLVLQNIRRLVASVHAFATTSKTMATAYIAWHSGWFGCGFGFGTPGPRHF